MLKKKQEECLDMYGLSAVKSSDLKFSDERPSLSQLHRFWGICLGNAINIDFNLLLTENLPKSYVLKRQI